MPPLSTHRHSTSFFVLSALFFLSAPCLGAEQWVSSIRASSQWASFPCTNYLVTHVCGTDKGYADPGALPAVISVGDTIAFNTSKGQSKTFTVRHINLFVFEKDVDTVYGGQRITARRGDTTCSLYDVNDRFYTRSQDYPSKIVIKGCSSLR